MDRGYVRLWRKSIESGWLQSPNLWSLWCWCLMKATHKEMDQVVGLQQVHLMPGEFIFGRKKASEELKMSEQTIRTNLDSLRKRKNLTIKPTNKFSVISIVNWNTYQDNGSQPNHQINQQTTSKPPASNHKQTHKNINTNKNPPISPPDFVSSETWTDFMEHRKLLKSPVTNLAAERIFKKLGEWRSEYGWDPNAVLNQSIEKGWKGIVELKDQIPNKFSFLDRIQ